jgi:hypothetical protein
MRRLFIIQAHKQYAEWTGCKCDTLGERRSTLGDKCIEDMGLSRNTDIGWCSDSLDFKLDSTAQLPNHMLYYVHSNHTIHTSYKSSLSPVSFPIRFPSIFAPSTLLHLLLRQRLIRWLIQRIRKPRWHPPRSKSPLSYIGTHKFTPSIITPLQSLDLFISKRITVREAGVWITVFSWVGGYGTELCFVFCWTSAWQI